MSVTIDASRTHRCTAASARMFLLCFLAGCTTLVDPALEAETSLPVIPVTEVFDIVPARNLAGGSHRFQSYAELIKQGKSPLPGALPGSEKVLMHVHRKGAARIELPYRRSGAMLWILVGCRDESALTIRTFDLSGAAIARYDLDPCRAAEGGGGMHDGTSAFAQVWTDPEVAYDITVISAELRIR